MEGISFITDKYGYKKQVVVDIDLHGKLLKKLFKKLDLETEDRVDVSPRTLHVNGGGGIEPIPVSTSQIEEVKNQKQIEIEEEEKKEIENTSFIQPDSVLSAMTLEDQEKALKIQAILEKAESLIGTPYSFGGVDNSGIDCSGFTSLSFGAAEIALPRISKDQSLVGNAITQTELKPGDLVFFGTGTPNSVNHVGIVAEANSPEDIKFIHASSSKGVTISSLNSGYWSGVYIKAKRVV
ncbi:C40 family peptidase [Chondrinema litorale]|uniref:C40 family peptidase n=1 Tax=Chondrinema litorale TaxID=2994555 RepID=UPI002543B1EF|nr:C40 family peptidase [Chondrinema litorale]UZR94186.1 C40 family peptidase [Chondrinema litorale]